MYLDVVLAEAKANISTDQEIVVLHEEGMFKICDIIRQHEKHNDQPLLNMFLVKHLVKSLMPYFDAVTFEDDIDPTKGMIFTKKYVYRKTLT